MEHNIQDESEYSMTEMTNLQQQFRMQEILSQLPLWTQKSIVNGYRKLVNINVMFGDQENDFINLISFIEKAFPGFSDLRIKNENGDINDRYYELFDMTKDSHVSESEYFKAVMEKECPQNRS